MDQHNRLPATTRDAVLCIARYTLLEALRNRLLWLVAVLVLVALTLAQLVGAIAITETHAYQAGLLAAFLRVGAVFTLSLFVVTSMLREYHDKGIELVLSMPIARADYLLGKLLGFAALAFIIAAACGVGLVADAAPSQALLWTTSLFSELLIIVALSLLFVITFNQVTWALSAVAGFYLLARGMAAMQLMGHGPLADQTALSQRVINALIDGLAFVLPRLDLFTRSEWVIHTNGQVADLAPIVAQSLIYVALLGGAALFDLYRKNL